jgi:hypothetical protein
MYVTQNLHVNHLIPQLRIDGLWEALLDVISSRSAAPLPEGAQEPPSEGTPPESPRDGKETPPESPRDGKKTPPESPPQGERSPTPQATPQAPGDSKGTPPESPEDSEEESPPGTPLSPHSRRSLFRRAFQNILREDGLSADGGSIDSTPAATPQSVLGPATPAPETPEAPAPRPSALKRLFSEKDK